MTELEKQILEHLKAIRDILETNGGVQYFEMTILDNGEMYANNSYWELPGREKIRIFEEGENYIEEENDDDR